MLAIIGHILLISAIIISVLALAVAADEWLSTRKIKKTLRSRYPAKK